MESKQENGDVGERRIPVFSPFVIILFLAHNLYLGFEKKEGEK